MTIHVLIPLFNRLELTKICLQCLRKQDVFSELNIIMIDDGSTDDTAEYLESQNDVTVLYGDGSLWWGGAIDVGLTYIQSIQDANDWVLLLNNDVTFTTEYIKNLKTLAQECSPAAVGSTLYDEENTNELISIGPLLDLKKIQISDYFDVPNWQNDLQAQGNDIAVLPVDALSGRGVLYPCLSLIQAGGMRPKILPHYLADYELSIRVKKSGYRLFVSPDVGVYSAREFGNLKISKNIWGKYFSTRSSKNLIANIAFWWSLYDRSQRLSFIFRLITRQFSKA